MTLWVMLLVVDFVATWWLVSTTLKRIRTLEKRFDDRASDRSRPTGAMSSYDAQCASAARMLIPKLQKGGNPIKELIPRVRSGEGRIGMID